MLRGGADRGYASITFNKKGDKMASVSTSPDFMLTVWDWDTERVALHAKAFGQVSACHFMYTIFAVMSVIFIIVLIICYYYVINIYNYLYNIVD